MALFEPLTPMIQEVVESIQTRVRRLPNFKRDFTWPPDMFLLILAGILGDRHFRLFSPTPGWCAHSGESMRTQQHHRRGRVAPLCLAQRAFPGSPMLWFSGLICNGIRLTRLCSRQHGQASPRCGRELQVQR